MSIYLIDYENVNLSGLSGIETLLENDRVYLFYGANPGYIPFEKHILIAKAKAEVTYLRVDRSGKNYLDFQLATYSGYLVAMYSEKEYVIVSRDTGFDSIVNFWNSDPEGRGVHFSRREAIVPPTPAIVKPSPSLVVANTPPTVPMMAREAYVPTRRAPAPQIEGGSVEKPAEAVEKEQTAEEQIVVRPRNRRRGRGGRGDRRLIETVSAPVAQKAETAEEKLDAETETPSEPLVMEAVVTEMQDALAVTEDAEMATEATEERISQSQSTETVAETLAPEEEIDEEAPTEEMLAEETVPSETVAEDIPVAEANDELLPETVEQVEAEEVKPAWGKLPTSFVSSQTIGVYVPGTAASGKMSLQKQTESETVAEQEEPTLAQVLSDSLDAVMPAPETAAELEAIPEQETETELATEQQPEETTEVESPAEEAEPAPEVEIVVETDAISAVEEPGAKEENTDPVEAAEAGRGNTPRRRGRRAGNAKPKASEPIAQVEPKTVEAKQQPSAPKLAERFKSRIREAVKAEELSSGAYTQIYNRVLKSDNKSRLNNDLVKAFSQEKGSRIYKAILPIYEEYRKTVTENNG